jgi:hypothetical protein
MRKVDLIICNPINVNQLEAAKKQVEDILSKNPGATTTWLQSSASRTLEASGGMQFQQIAAQHVLTCIVEYNNTMTTRDLATRNPQGAGTNKAKPRGQR